MSKARITRLFLSSIIAGIAGATLGAIAWSHFPSDVFVLNGSEIVALHGSVFAWAMLGLGIAGALLIIGAALAGLASWIGALLFAAGLERKRWFVGLALLGVFNCGLLAVFAFVVAGPRDRGIEEGAFGASAA